MLLPVTKIKTITFEKALTKSAKYIQGVSILNDNNQRRDNFALDVNVKLCNINRRNHLK